LRFSKGGIPTACVTILSWISSGTDHELTHQQSGFVVSHPFAKGAKGWGTLCWGDAKKRSSHRLTEGICYDRTEGSNPVPRRLDAFIPEIDFGLAAMGGHMNVHGEQDFSSEEAPSGELWGAQLLFGEVWDDGRAIVEGIYPAG
jgi:hypothetical protein